MLSPIKLMTFYLLNFDVYANIDVSPIPLKTKQNRRMISNVNKTACA